jgi:DNA primase
MIPDDIVEQVRTQADIVAIVGEVVKLKRVGNSYRGPCPFHQGKNANFAVTPGGGFVCFVCGEKGDVFTFVQKRLGLDFVDAVKYVGAKSGVDVKEVSRDAGQVDDPRQRFWEINAAAAEYFREQLWAEGGGDARGYLESRALSREQADRFGMGFAPRDPAGLRSHLNSLGYDDAVLLQSGLLVEKEEGAIRARFRNRLMFPIYDVQGRVVAFGGRVIGQGEPKYLNSAESPTFQKGSTLYGLNWARHAIRRDGRVLLVEGYFDCVRLLAAGIESAVAPLGTALADGQATLIAKYTSTAFLLYDSDQAGLKATFRNGDVLLRHGIKVLVVTLPDGEDPDTFVRAHGARALEAQLGAAIDVFERKLQILQRGGWLTDLRRKRVALDRLLPTIRAASDAITRGMYLSQASEAVGVSQDVLERELRQPTRGERPALAPTPAPATRSEVPVRATERRKSFVAAGVSAERELVRLLLHRRQDIEGVAERVGTDSFRDPPLASIFDQLLRAPEQSLQELEQAIDEDAVGVLADLAANRGGLELPARIVDDCLSKFRQREIGERLEVLDREIPLANEAGKDALIGEKNRLQKEMQSLKGGRYKAFGRASQ